MTGRRMACEHENFEAQVEVNRLCREPDGPVEGMSASIAILCATCAEPMVFVGAPVGLSPRHPAINVEGTELRSASRTRAMKRHR